MAIVRFTAEEIAEKSGDADWFRLATMTNAEVEAAAASDPDNSLLTEEELKHFKPAKSRGAARGLEEAESPYEAPQEIGEGFVLSLLHHAMFEIQLVQGHKKAQAIAEVFENTLPVVRSAALSPRLLEIVRIRAEKLGVMDDVERIIQAALCMSAKSNS